MIETKKALLESMWYEGVIARRSSRGGTEICRQTRRLGAGHAMITVYENWGDLYFEASDPVLGFTMTLQVKMEWCVWCVSLWNTGSKKCCN